MANAISGGTATTVENIRAQAAINIARLRSIAATVKAAADLAVFQRSFELEQDSAELQNSLLKRQINMQRIFWRKELEQLAEYKDDKPVDSPEIFGKRYAGRVNAVIATKYAKALKKLKGSQSRWCTSNNEQNLQSLYIAKATDQTTARIQGRQIGFAEHHDRKATIFNRRLQTVGLGNGAVGPAAQLAQAGGAIAKTMGQSALQSLSGDLAMIRNAGVNTGVEADSFYAKLGNQMALEMSAQGQSQMTAAISSTSAKSSADTISSKVSATSTASGIISNNSVNIQSHDTSLGSQIPADVIARPQAENYVAMHGGKGHTMVTQMNNADTTPGFTGGEAEATGAKTESHFTDRGILNSAGQGFQDRVRSGWAIIPGLYVQRVDIDMYPVAFADNAITCAMSIPTRLPAMGGPYAYPGSTRPVY